MDNLNKTEPRDYPVMLWQVLTEEYEALGIFDKADVDSVKAERERLKKEKDIPGGCPTTLLERRQEMHSELVTYVHQLAEKSPDSITALCFSGGGIRSATFGLGVIQCLAQNGLLGKFHYLSSVSGGGYISSWLTAWIYRTAEKKNRIQSRQNAIDTQSVLDVEAELNSHTENQPEPDEIKHLRTYSNYMSPKAGLFSTDTWALIAIYLRNLLLNWTVIIPFVVAILLLPKILLNWFRGAAEESSPFVTVIGTVLGLFGIVCINMMRPSFKKTSPFQQNFSTDDIGQTKSPDWMVKVFCMLPVMAFAFCLNLQQGWSQNEVSSISFSYFVMYGVVLVLGGYWLALIFMFVWRLFANTGAADTKKTFLHKLWNRIWESVFSAISGGVGGIILYLVSTKVLYNQQIEMLGISKNEFLVCFGVPAFLIVFLLGATLLTGLTIWYMSDDDREWATRFGAILLKVTVAWSIASFATIYGPKLFESGWLDDIWGKMGAVMVVISGALSALGGFSGKTPGGDNQPAESKSGLLISIASSVVAPIAVLFLLMFISYATHCLQYYVLAGSELETVFANFAQVSPDDLGERYKSILFWFFAAVGTVMGFFISINKFSFHSAYRDRLIRAYLGASNQGRFGTANSFIGLDTEADNVEMKNLKQRPFHVLNMALNMVRGSNLAWQNRKAESFTSTALHSGSSQMGASGNYRQSEHYAVNKQNGRAITLGTAAAISGAAASPNMGHFTQSTAVRFLMVLLNVRLGWWLGNPGRRGASFGAWKKSSPLWSPLSFLNESLGWTDDTHAYVYLADGGQFENLGLYEMVKRRCKTIVLCDAGADPKSSFFDLGSAIHKIRVDMGIPIDFKPGREPTKEKYGAFAKIKYSEVDGEAVSDGVLIYIKPTINNKEPIDIQHYHSQNTDFPHEGTLDQFYSETQFESYRSLGFHMMETLSDGKPLKTLADLVHNVKENTKA